MQQCGCKHKQEKFWVWIGCVQAPSSPNTTDEQLLVHVSGDASDSVRGCFQLVLTVISAGIAPLWLKYQPTFARDLPVTDNNIQGQLMMLFLCLCS